MSIKNRYNHTVDECDSTLNNNLDLLVPGLQTKVLGYYGIAFLNKGKSYYKNIVNINGIYLKYSAEVNNVYFGDFVLDNENGVRFEDHSRYYVGVGYTDPWYYRKNLYVLDFQNKEVIKLFDERDQLSKGTLLSRAMKENLLNSGNKEKIDELNAVFPDALKELLQCRKKTLKYLAECYGYDFQKPFKVTGLLGKFTAKSIEKITGINRGMLLVCEGADVNCVELNRGKFDVAVQKGYNYSIDYYSVKCDFEADRKSGKLGVFIIQQDAEHRRKVEESSASPYRYNSYEDEFDHSGFNVTENRERLQQRARKYKADKKKREAATVSYEADLKEIKEMFRTMKEKLVLKLSEAETADDYEKITDVFNLSFVWMVRNLGQFEDKVAKHSFYSVEEADDSIAHLKEKITEIENNLA